jgi:hypothetical protein
MAFCGRPDLELVKPMIRLFAALPIPDDIGLALARRCTSR